MKVLDIIKTDNLTARKAKDKFTSGILTTLIGEISIVGKNEGNRETTEEEALKVITKFKNGVIDSIESLQGSHNWESNQERIVSLQEEAELYDKYLPQLMNEEELRNILLNWKETNYPDVPNIGGYMSALKRVHGGKYDGKMANKILKEIL